MKKGITIIIILLVLGAAAPFGFGFWADARMQAMFKDFNEAGVVNFTVLKSEKGWLSSQAVIEVEMAGNLAKGYLSAAQKNGAGNAQVPKMYLHSTIHHGPFPMTSKGFSFTPVIASVDSKMMKSAGEDAEPLLNIDYKMMTRFPLQGGNKSVIDIADWKGPVGKGNATAEWKDLKLTMAFSDGLRHADINMAVPLVRISGQGGEMVLEGMTMTSVAEPGIEDLALGDGKFAVKRLSFNDSKSGAAFHMNDLSLTANTSDSGNGNVDSVMDMRLQTLELTGDRFGPAVFAMAFRNLDAGAVARINKQVRELRRQKNMPQDQQGMMMMATMASELGNLLKKGPVIEITELSLASDYGRMLGTARISVDTSNPAMLTNPLLVKDAIIGEMDLQMPEELMVALNKTTLRRELQGVNISYTEEQIETMAKQRVNKMMTPLVGANIFTKDGNMYKFTASINNGIPEVNGRPFQFPIGAPAGRPQ